MFYYVERDVTVTDRLRYIDVFRAIAILVVTGFHLWRYLGKKEYIVGIYDLFAIFERGAFGVSLFFVISGYCMALSVYKYRDKILSADFYRYYLLKRIIRIVPAYYVAIIVWNVLLAYGVTPDKTRGIVDNITHPEFRKYDSLKT